MKNLRDLKEFDDTEGFAVLLPPSPSRQQCVGNSQRTSPHDKKVSVTHPTCHCPAKGRALPSFCRYHHLVRRCSENIAHIRQSKPDEAVKAHIRQSKRLYETVEAAHAKQSKAKVAMGRSGWRALSFCRHRHLVSPFSADVRQSKPDKTVRAHIRQSKRLYKTVKTAYIRQSEARVAMRRREWGALPSFCVCECVSV